MVVLLTVAFGGKIIVLTIVEPVYTPTILTLDVSVTPSRAHRLSMNELITVLAKKF